MTTMKRLLGFSLLIGILTLSLSASENRARFFVAVNGRDSNPGTAEAPVASLGKAVALAEGQPLPSEIIIRGGTYYLSRSVRIPRSKKQCRLIIRAAENETVVFDGSIPLPASEPLQGRFGVYLIKGNYPTDAPPTIWEETTGKHFQGLAGLDSVQARDYSSLVLDERTLAIRYRSNIPPSQAAIRMSSPALYGFEMLRDNVTVQGLTFQNFVAGRSASGIMIGATGMSVTDSGGGKTRQGTFVANTVIDSCVSRHCCYGFRVYLTGKNTLIARCKTRNCVAGVYVSGLDTTVEHCELINDPDFHTEKLTWDYKFDRCGIRFYNKPGNAVVRCNFIKGFESAGIHSKGSPGTYIVEHNTIVGIPRSFSVDAGFRLRYNIFADNITPFRSDLKGELEAEIDYNLFWGPRDLTATIKNKKLGGAPNNFFADPMFASPDQGDYRLLPNSPALGVFGKQHLGAYPRVPDNFRAPLRSQTTTASRAKETKPRTPVKTKPPVESVGSRPPRITYVATGGTDVETAGSREKPFATIAFALERVRPGDRVRVMPGVYFGELRLERVAGTPEQPLIIEGLFPNTVTLDGLREVDTLLRLQEVSHVVLRNLNFCWYNDSAMLVTDSPHVRVTGCRFLNQYWRGGSGATCRTLIFARSPKFIVDHCIIAQTRYGLVVEASPGGQFLHNTAAANSVTHLQWRGPPTDDIVIQYNSLNWNGNSMLVLDQPAETIQKHSIIDYNNYGTTFLRPEGAEDKAGQYGKSLQKPFPYLPSNREFIAGAKKFVNMEDWLKYSGQDKHSIFADPKWINPRAGRFDVAADSPNLLPNGKIIGALGYLGENPNTLPEIVITDPYPGQTLKGAFSLGADASDHDGSIQKVEFYAGNKLLGAVAAKPYRLPVVTLPVGRHAITARATDNRGGMAISDEVWIQVGK
ncbi:MAG: hypothetical protein FJ395_15920 [Verrucomicrobia bacterium]|nr:hypothetical protein [Verrucomicrobiota bacterium]